MTQATLPTSFRRAAVNNAAESTNKIHSDEEARRRGYAGALVPGVTLYAYLTQLALPQFGPDWLARGAARVRLLRPVYATEEVECRAEPLDGIAPGAIRLTCTRVADGVLCAEGAAWLPDTVPDAALRDLPLLPDLVQPDPLPELTPDRVPLGVPLVPLPLRYTAEDAARYAAETEDNAPYFYEATAPFGTPLLPPGVLAARQANLIRYNFQLGPSIHVASEIQHLAPAPADTLLRTGGVIVEMFERKGNSYLVMDAMSTADDVPVVRVRHTTIFAVRAGG